MSHPMFTPEFFAEHREHLGWWRPGNERRILDYLAELQAEVEQLLADQQARITTVTVTATTGESIVSKNLGDTITFTAASTDKDGNPVADTYTWTATAGTIVPGADSTTITISDAPVGDVTATATDPSGISGSATETVVDAPATVTVTAS